MEDKKRNIPKMRNSVKIRDIHTKFKNARKVSYSKNSECGKKEKRVMFLEPPKEIKKLSMKKTQVISIPKSLEQKLQTDIEKVISKKNRNEIRKPSLKKCHTSNSFIKLPVLKTKVVNINNNFFMPFINKYKPRTIIINNNPLKEQKTKMKSKRKNTFEKDVLYKNLDELDNNIKKIKKEILRKNTEENGRRYESKFSSKKNNLIPYDNHRKYDENIPNPEDEMKKMRSLSKCENTSNTAINENNKEEDIKEINDSNKIDGKDDNLTNKTNGHKKYNSVDVKKEKKNKNGSFFKNLFCCLNG
jgi:hypothetical protein